MKRILFLPAIVLLCVYAVSAAPIDLKKAREIANTRFLEAPAKFLRAEAPVTLSYTRHLQDVGLRAADGSEPVAYYVFNRGNNEGFVIVAGDDRMPEIIGYSFTGKFVHENMPDNLSYWMNRYERMAEGLVKNRITVETSSSSPDNSLRAKDPTCLLDSKNIYWGQGSPWNNEAPSGTPIGCVATAIGQIMAYHCWPAESEGTYTEINWRTFAPGKTYDYDGIEYDWDLILKGGSTEKYGVAAGAVADLMILIARGVNMNFGKNGSGTNDPFVPRLFRENFRYMRDCQLWSRDFFPLNKWKAMLRAEIDAKRPVYYSGATSEAGHAFVCDGYDDTGKFHFNWGWGDASPGYSNGYYDLNRMIPSETGTGAGNGDYSENQTALFNLRPAKNLSQRGASLPPAIYIESGYSDYQLRADVTSDKNLRVRYGARLELDLTVPKASTALIGYDPDNKPVEALNTGWYTLENPYFAHIFTSGRNGSKFPPEAFEEGKQYTFKVMYRIGDETDMHQAIAYLGKRSEIQVTRKADNTFDIKYVEQKPIATLGIEPIPANSDAASQEMKISPNPASNTARVVPGDASAPTYIYDLSGRLVCKFAPVAEGQQLSVDVSTMSAGIYVVQNGVFTARLIVR